MEQLGFSKINIGLAILNKRPDGYHNIDTVFQSIHLGDSIYFAKHHSVVFSGMAPELPSYMNEMIPYDESNLALKALRAVQEYTGCKTGGAIHLLKRVPPLPVSAVAVVTPLPCSSVSTNSGTCA